MKAAALIWLMALICSTGCRMYSASPEKLISRQVKFLDTDKADTLLDFSADQPLRTAITAASKNSSCFYLGYAPRTRTKKVRLEATRRLFEAFNQQAKYPKSTDINAVLQHGDTLQLADASISHITIDDNIYRFNDFNFMAAEFRRVLKPNGQLVIRIVEFRKAVLNIRQQAALKDKPEGTTQAFRQYFEQRGFRLVKMHRIGVDRPLVRTAKEKELLFVFAKNS